MRNRLLQPLGDPRQRRRRRARQGSSHAASPTSPASGGPRPLAQARSCDLDAERVRQAGGPIDRAAYGCCCGYQFSAPVSTTVCCPHCGGEQAW